MAPINATISGGPQITASVGETKIDVSVGGGVGPTGTSGSAATIAVGAVTTGAPGSSATVTNVGTSSAAVLDFAIPAGATGAAGPQGETGAAGQAATVTVGTVTTGAAGSSASVVNSGTSGAAVLDFTIPAGATGATGPSGPAGGTGPAGAAATISVGTVTTGAAGSSASVTNVGTSSAAVFNFTIPAGATGPQGPQGATGPAGTTTWAGITDKPSTFTPSAHTHGNITNDGKIGTTASQIVVTGSGGSLTTAATISSSQVSGLKFRGTWAAGTYSYGDLVFYDSPPGGTGAFGLFVCASSTTFTEPGSAGPDWELIGPVTELNFSQVSDTATYPNFLPEGGSLATALSGIDSALGGKAAASHEHEQLADLTLTGDTTFNLLVGGEIEADSILLAGNDLATTLDGKASLSHAHSAADITSGTLNAARLPKIPKFWWF